AQCTNNLKQIGLALHNYHDVNGSFPMGAGSDMEMLDQYLAKQAWSYLGAILPQLGEVPLYNACNFNFGVDSSNQPCLVNRSGITAQVKAFVCPSDPYAGTLSTGPGTNNYYGSVGTTTNLNNTDTNTASLANVPTSGLFAFQSSTSIPQCLDGLSNTVAVSEAIVGGPTQNFGGKDVGLKSVTGIPAAAQPLTPSPTAPP